MSLGISIIDQRIRKLADDYAEQFAELLRMTDRERQQDNGLGGLGPMLCVDGLSAVALAADARLTVARTG